MIARELPDIDTLIEQAMQRRSMQMIPACSRREAALIYAEGYLIGIRDGVQFCREVAAKAAGWPS